RHFSRPTHLRPPHSLLTTTIISLFPSGRRNVTTSSFAHLLAFAASPQHNLAVVLLLSEIVQIHALPRLTIVRK
ncbi:hypothetical protein L195_g060823, partial [Trifolium pratense]